MRLSKKKLCAVLAAIMICSLVTACGMYEKAEPSADPSQAASGKVWSADFLELGIDEGFWPNSVSLDSERVLLTGTITEDYTYSPVILKANIDGTGLERLPEYVPIEAPEGEQMQSDITALCADADGGVWIFERGNCYSFDLPEGFSGTDEERYEYYIVGESLMYLRRLDANGAELQRIDVSEHSSEDEYFYVNSMICDAQGNLYITDGSSRVIAFSPEGEQLLDIETQDWINELVNLADGTVAASSYGMITLVSLETKSMDKTIEMSQNFNKVYSGTGEYDFFYSASSKLYGYQIESKQSTEIFSFLDCSINEDYIAAAHISDDGSVQFVSRNYETDKTELVLVSERDASELPQKVTLTLATMYLSQQTRNRVLEFNRQSDKYRIEVTDYSQYNTDEDSTLGMTKLNTEIMTGNVPDIIDANELPANMYASKGLLEDLYPYIDADAELSRDDIIPKLLESMETDGKLYRVSSAFGVYSLIGRSDVVGEEMGWTLDELMELYNSQPEGTELLDYGATMEQVFDVLCMMNLDSYVNWQTNECSFDSQDFIDVLKFCQLLPNADEYNEDNYESTPSRISSGKQFLSLFGSSSFDEVQMYEAMYEGKVTYKGFPCPEGVGNYAILQNGLSMSSTCADKDGAWSFIREILTEEYQSSGNTWSYPTNQKAFDALMADAMEKTYSTDPETGEQVEDSKGGWSWDNFSIDIYAMTEEQAAQTLELIDSIRGAVNIDQNVMDILHDETAAFFAGEKSAEDTAKLIQSRVSLYVGEQG